MMKKNCLRMYTTVMNYIIITIPITTLITMQLLILLSTRFKNLAVSDKVKNDVISIYKLIAQAESKAHGVDVSEIHFHEVGMMDAIADVTCCAMLMEEINPDKVVVSPINTGFGKVKCAHGILPVPAPATANLLEGMVCYSGNIEGELCTPTGAAILKYYVNEFGNMPAMIMEKQGYGMGNKDFPVANCIRAILGEKTEKQFNYGK